MGLFRFCAVPLVCRWQVSSLPSTAAIASAHLDLDRLALCARVADLANQIVRQVGLVGDFLGNLLAGKRLEDVGGQRRRVRIGGESPAFGAGAEFEKVLSELGEDVEVLLDGRGHVSSSLRGEKLRKLTVS